MPSSVVSAVLGAVLVVLLLNLIVALIVFARRSLANNWLLVILLAGWFLGQSAAGGVDVARRALGRRPDIEPAVVRAPVDLPEGHARQLAMLLMNLMPGSMIQRAPGSTGHDAAASAGGDQVELHTLSVSLDPAGQWSRLQRRVAQAAR